MGLLKLRIGSFEFPIMPLTLPKIDFNWKPSGLLVSKVETWPIRGWFVGVTSEFFSGSGSHSWKAFRTLLQTVQTVQLFEDSTLRDELNAGEHNNTPRFENLRMEDTRGAMANNIQFTLDIVAERPLSFAGIVDLDRRIEEDIDRKENTSSKTATFTARGNNAESFIRGLKPTFTGLIQERYITEKEGNSFTATWTFKTKAKDNLVSFNERITISGGLHSINWVPVMHALPFRIIGKRRHAVVTVTGTIRTTERTDISREISIPPPLKKEDLVELDESVPFVVEFLEPGVPRVWQKDYSMTFFRQERPDLPGLRVRIKN